MSDVLRLPAHKCELSITHNTHTCLYQSASVWLEDQAREGGEAWFEWENDEARLRSIATGEIWTMQWYPETPVGFLAVAAPTLQELLDFALRASAEEA